jgi:hypothetical protein
LRRATIISATVKNARYAAGWILDTTEPVMPPWLMPSAPNIPDDTAKSRKTMTRNSPAMTACASCPVRRAALSALRRGEKAASCAVITMS